ncbi:MAG: MFS transporter, partial [Stackebrandtia sp.]
VTGGSNGMLTAILFVLGLGVLGGNLLAGRLADRYPPHRVLNYGLAAAIVALAMTTVATQNPATAFGWAAVWGLLVGVPVVPQQYRLVAYAPSATPILLGLNSAAIYLGIALGGALGGVTEHWAGPGWLGISAAVVTAAGLALALTSAGRRKPPQPELDPVAGRQPSS